MELVRNNKGQFTAGNQEGNRSGRPHKIKYIPCIFCKVKPVKNKVYLMNAKNTNYYKIGITSDVKKRLSTIQCGNPNEIICIKSDDG